VLCTAVEADVPYLGLVASRRRGAAVLDEIAAERPDLAVALRARVDTPAGLDLGARTAGEIAVSILAAIVRARAARINYGRADQTPGNVTGEAGVGDLVHAPVRADQMTRNVTGEAGVNDFGRAGEVDPRGKARPDPASTAGTAVDPVCGMTVATVPASLHTEHAGRTVWFCGPGCRRAFESEPSRTALSNPAPTSPDCSEHRPTVSSGGLASSADSVP
jgi:xanthine dehydrogenase accessory factor